jgi:dihydrofolate reductase
VTRLSVVVAADERGGIGHAGGLPWHLPADLKRFKAITMGKPIVMGRRTWDSIGRPLPGRRSIVVSRQAGLAIEGAEVVGSLEEALRVASDAPESCVIGGAELYRLALPMAGLVHLTRVHATVEADTFLPELDPSDWEEVSSERHPADERHAYPYSFVTLRRVRAPASA